MDTLNQFVIKQFLHLQRYSFFFINFFLTTYISNSFQSYK